MITVYSRVEVLIFAKEIKKKKHQIFINKTFYSKDHNHCFDRSLSFKLNKHIKHLLACKHASLFSLPFPSLLSLPRILFISWCPEKKNQTSSFFYPSPLAHDPFISYAYHINHLQYYQLRLCVSVLIFSLLFRCYNPMFYYS